VKSDLSPAFRCSDGIAKCNFQIGEVVNLSLLGALPGNQPPTVEELETLTMGEMTAMTTFQQRTAWQITFTTPTGANHCPVAWVSQ